jgi:hypothetical protein
MALKQMIESDLHEAGVALDSDAIRYRFDRRRGRPPLQDKARPRYARPCMTSSMAFDDLCRLHVICACVSGKRPAARAGEASRNRSAKSGARSVKRHALLAQPLDRPRRDYLGRARGDHSCARRSARWIVGSHGHSVSSRSSVMARIGGVPRWTL